MKKIIPAVALLVSAANTHRRPKADSLNNRIQRYLVQGKGPMAEAARVNLKRPYLAEKEENRGVRRTVKECIKPGNVIDDDVQECVRGYREKNW